MDVSKLITWGKITKKVIFTVDNDEFVFHLASPEAEIITRLVTANDSLGIIVSCVTKVEHPATNEVKEIATNEDAKWLHELLGRMQSNGIVWKLSNLCAEMAQQQQGITENFTKVS